MDNTAKKLLLFNLNKDIISLYKRQLISIEDLYFAHQEFLKKLENFVEKDIIDQMDYFTEETFQHLRKRSLDSGNETLRNLEKSSEQFIIDFNRNKE